MLFFLHEYADNSNSVRKLRLSRLLWLLLANLMFGQQFPFLLVPGGPTNIRQIFQDHAGRLWVASSIDLACFDGSRFYSLRDFGFQAIDVSAIDEDSDGAIWIGTRDGVYRFYKGEIARVVPGVVRAVAVTSGTVLAMVGQQGPSGPSFLFRIRRNGTVWQSDKIMPLPWPVRFSLDRRTASLIMSFSAAWGEAKVKDVLDWRAGDSQVPVTMHPSRPGFAIMFSRDQFGCVWSRTQAFTAYQCLSDPAPIELPDFIAARGSSISENFAGDMLFVNKGRLVLGRPGHFKRVTPAQGMPDVNVAMTAMDGTIWLGGPKGLYYWPYPFRLEYWTAREGFAGTGRICRVGQRFFAGNGQDGVAVLSDDRARWLPLPRTKSLGMVMDLIPDSQGGLYAGLRLGGLAQIQADGAVIARAGQHLDWVFRFLKTPSGQLWASGTKIWEVRQATHHLTLIPQDLPPLGTQALDLEVERSSGKVWACWAPVALLHRETDGWHGITDKDGLREKSCGSVAVLPNGDIWLGYDAKPYFARVRLAADGQVNVKNFGPSRAGENTFVMFVDTDSRGWLWRGTQDGVFVADSQDAEENRWSRLSEVDGLPSADVNRESFYSDVDGSVWWLARDFSLVHFSPPDDFVRPSFAPKIFVSSVSANDGPAKLVNTNDAILAGSTVTVHLGTLQFDRRNTLRWRYRIGAADAASWNYSDNSDLPLGTLSWGDHKLEVEAKLGTGPWSATAAQTLTVLRPFWATWPFLVGLVFVGGAAGFGGYRSKQRWDQIKRRTLPDLSGLRVDAIVPDAHKLIGVALDGRYIPNKVIARGGFATVFAGYDKKQDCRCAIKVFHQELVDQGLGQRFAQEITALETVLHPNVVRIYGHGKTPMGVPYLVMEFIEGQTLRQALSTGPLPAAETAQLLRQAGRALAAIHAQGICHRDLKPDNLMIRTAANPGEELVLIDFSIAIVKSPDMTVHGLSKAAGTIQYMAPEQAVGWADASSDIYSLAKVLMEMMSGQRLSELLPDASRDLPVRVEEFLARPPCLLSLESIKLIGAALQFDPDRRPHDAVAFAEKIAADLDQSQSKAAVN